MRKTIVALLAFALAACQTARMDKTVVVAKRMLDPAAGRYVENAAVYLDGYRITRVTTGRPLDRSYGHVIHVETLLPGLIDAHTHLAWAGSAGHDAALATLEAGFTRHKEKEHSEGRVSHRVSLMAHVLRGSEA